MKAVHLKMKMNVGMEYQSYIRGPEMCKTDPYNKQTFYEQEILNLRAQHMDSISHIFDKSNHRQMPWKDRT